MGVDLNLPSILGCYLWNRSLIIQRLVQAKPLRHGSVMKGWEFSTRPHRIRAFSSMYLNRFSNAGLFTSKFCAPLDGIPSPHHPAFPSIKSERLPRGACAIQAVGSPTAIQLAAIILYPKAIDVAFGPLDTSDQRGQIQEVPPVL